MICKWESREERLLRFMRISPKKKLEWLLEINEFLNKSRLQADPVVHAKNRLSRLDTRLSPDP